jgi:GNAT superfamily N-acetyltransferase
MRAESARSAEQFELEEIVRLWSICFGDSPELVHDIFAVTGLLDTTVVAGAPDAMMTAFDGLSLAGRQASYIYALCTRPEKRGLGLASAVLSRIIADCFERGAQLVCLHPADLSLWRWYRDEKGFSPLCLAQPRELELLPAAEGSVREISAEEFFRFSGEFHDVSSLDSRFRSSEPYGAGYPLPLLRAQELFWRGGAGAFLEIACAGAKVLAQAEKRGDALVLKHLSVAPNAAPSSLDRTLATLAAHHFGLTRASVLEPVAPDVEKLPDLCYVARDDGFVPNHNFVFPLLLD